MKFKKIILSTTAATGLFFAGTGLANADTVTVKSGDTVSSIAQTYQTTVTNIEKLNHLSNVNSIYIGQKLETGTSDKNQTNSNYRYSSVQQPVAKKASKTGTDTSKQIGQPSNTNSQTTKNSALNSTVAKQQSAKTQNVSSTDTNASQQTGSGFASTTTNDNNNTNTSTNSASTTSSDSSESSAKAWIANKESGGSYTATNGQYYGKYQLTLSYLNGDLSSSNQESVADSYVKSTYGSWSAAKAHWESNGWY
ncbi:LysM peptidoglycan-binding domain-containing protein [Ligilactobacillus pobuzihii]|uniref:Peptidoglycan binding protein n=1 Tax=Ligilactobacillus pobuzihii TaxID=449659 RepID=A0A0R2LK80_9LACO|nr:LysM peptidoglycan-binding domain-containing protein [Ligilactobacillus pobuzihii]KRK10255.1 peptidoglycan binding protein [Ligilactobacillus pobuzihii E100301 = KCTC 13174]KRO02072.1 peptidoglycan binding protein [Ligilactobacillus pobuzihii]GEN48169.1 peptidase M23 [Ligilactobacillus pobuzihii]